LGSFLFETKRDVNISAHLFIGPNVKGSTEAHWFLLVLLPVFGGYLLTCQLSTFWKGALDLGSITLFIWD